MTQIVKVERKTMEEKIVNEKTKSLVGLREKLLCLSIDEVNMLQKFKSKKGSQRFSVSWAHARF